MTKFRVPTFRYPGGKARLAPWLISMMPCEGRVYAEPFAGRANVFWRAALTLRFDEWRLNDPYTAAFLRAITDVPLADIPYNVSWKRAHELVRAAADGSSPLAALLEPMIAFSGGVRGASPGRSSNARSFRGAAYSRTIQNARRVLRRARPRITNADWTTVTDDLRRGDFAYLDPPYLGACEHDYRVNNVDHAALVRCLVDAEFAWLLSGYQSDLYQHVLGDPVATRVIRCSMGNRRAGTLVPKRVECVWRKT